MNYMSYLLAFSFTYIFGLIMATAVPSSAKFALPLYLAATVIIAIGISLYVIHKKNLSVPTSRILWTLMLGAFVLGYARYTHFNTFSDPNHISQFAAEGFAKDNAEYDIIGKISSEPDMYYDKTKLTVSPLLIKNYKDRNSGYKEVIGGDIIVQIKRLDRDAEISEIWKEYSVPEAYGEIVRIRGKLVKPMPASCIGGYDQRDMMRMDNTFAILFNPSKMSTLNETQQMSNQELKAYKANKEKYAPMYLITKLALNVKRKMLATFKNTMPYPESAFLGGITLGLKRGLQNVPTILNDYWKPYSDSIKLDNPKIVQDFLAAYNPITDKMNQLITVQFQWAGTGHVLAVSGLHVTIITIFLFGIFTAH